MLFYHLELRCYVVIELKAGKFKPAFTGKLNFYLSAVDSQLKRPEDNPSIGILLCKKKDIIEAEYSLRDINKPIGISDYFLTHTIPAQPVTIANAVLSILNDSALKKQLIAKGLERARLFNSTRMAQQMYRAMLGQY